MLSYREALEYILGLANYETAVDTDAAAARFNLDTVGRLAAAAGWKGGRYVHIAGTKGKGSTAAMLESILRCAGYCTGLFTSPHLHSFRERIRVSGRLIPEQDVARLACKLRPLVSNLQQQHMGLAPVTTFDFLVVMALIYFQQKRVDLGVMEAGLGGRLDATNVITPLVSVITSISYDHTRILGSSLTAIAREKAGIIKPGVPTVIAPQKDEALAVLERACREKGSPMVLVGRDYRWQETPNGLRIEGPGGEYNGLCLGLAGPFQGVNATTAVAVLEALGEEGFRVDESALRDGLARVIWPGRLEVLRSRPLIVADGAHNADSAEKLAAALRSQFTFDRLHLVLGISADKDITGIVSALAPLASSITFVRSQHPRAASFEQMEAGLVGFTGTVSRAAKVAEAIAETRRIAGAHDLICVTGSLFVVAEAREALGYRSIFARRRSSLCPRRRSPLLQDVTSTTGSKMA